MSHCSWLADMGVEGLTNDEIFAFLKNCFVCMKRRRTIKVIKSSCIMSFCASSEVFRMQRNLSNVLQFNARLYFAAKKRKKLRFTVSRIICHTVLLRQTFLICST